MSTVQRSPRYGEVFGEYLALLKDRLADIDIQLATRPALKREREQVRQALFCLGQLHQLQSANAENSQALETAQKSANEKEG